MTEDVILTDEELNMVEELRGLREERKDLEARESEIRKELLQVLAGAPQGLTGSGAVAVKVTTQVRRNVDRAKLEALHPEIFETVVSESSVLIVTLP